MSRLRSLLATLRIANAPSVVSNVCLGLVLGGVFASILLGGVSASILLGSEAFGWKVVSLPILSGLLLYFAGNLANDWFDLDWDRERRPERALPSGRFQRRSYLIAAFVAATLGTVIAFVASIPTGLAAVFILICVVIYTWIHKRTAWSVIPMGLCRAGLYLLGLMSWWSWAEIGSITEGLGSQGVLTIVGVIATFCSGLLAYIAGLSMSARYEGMEDAPPGPKVIARALLAFPLLAMSCWLFFFAPKIGWVGMIPYGIWLTLCLTRYRRPIPAHVSALLAGIPLVDAIFLLPVGLALGFQSSEPKSLAIVAAVLPFAAFVLGRALQKLAPAT